MASTVIGPKSLQDESIDFIKDKLTQYVPMFAQNMERGAGDLVCNLEQIIEHELWRVMGCESMNEYAFKHLNGHTEVWCKEVIRVFNEEWDRKRQKTGTVGEVSEAASKSEQVIARAKESQQLYSDGLTQQQVAERLGVSRRTVSDDLARNTVYTEKPAKQKRKQIQYKINSGTKPSTAATKIIETFGVEFALSLAKELLKS